MRYVVFVAAMVFATSTIVPIVVGFDRAGEAHLALREAQSWGYQLQHLNPEALSGTDLDILVIDHSRDGSADARLTPAELEILKIKPDGSRRVVLSYLSIGEAEDYRRYWRKEWAAAPPHWLGAENPDWPGNYAVQYWDKAWQDVIFGDSDALLDTILDQGFDGVYLDRVDAYYGRPERARAAMMDFVSALAGYAREREPGFLIIQQNAEDLMADEAHRALIDGLAKEDLYFGIAGDGVENAARTVATSLKQLAGLEAEGKPVLVIEYDLDASERLAARMAAERAGFIVTFAKRPLDALPHPG